MTYKSPIEIIQQEIEMKVENDIYSAVQKVGINVDKDELVKALEYDRNQYQKGYEDAKTLYENPEPYKFEDLKEGMWVWDNENKEVIYIDFIKRNRIYFYTCKYDDGLFYHNFQENRFFPVQMANAGCEKDDE